MAVQTTLNLSVLLQMERGGAGGKRIFLFRHQARKLLAKPGLRFRRKRVGQPKGDEVGAANNLEVR